MSVTSVQPRRKAQSNDNPVQVQDDANQRLANGASSEADTFQSTQSGDSQNNNRAFSSGNALKNFLKGIISPITMIIKNPLAALPMIVVGGALAFFCPATIPFMLIAGIGFSGFELGKGVINFSSSYSKGNVKGMEDSFKETRLSSLY